MDWLGNASKFDVFSAKIFKLSTAEDKSQRQLEVCFTLSEHNSSERCISSFAPWDSMSLGTPLRKRALTPIMETLPRGRPTHNHGQQLVTQVWGIREESLLFPAQMLTWSAIVWFYAAICFLLCRNPSLVMTHCVGHNAHYFLGVKMFLITSHRGNNDAVLTKPLYNSITLEAYQLTLNACVIYLPSSKSMPTLCVIPTRAFSCLLWKHCHTRDSYMQLVWHI